MKSRTIPVTIAAATFIKNVSNAISSESVEALSVKFGGTVSGRTQTSQKLTDFDLVYPDSDSNLLPVIQSMIIVGLGASGVRRFR
jgi:hypothetical protein